VKVFNDLSKKFGNDSEEKIITENVLYLKEHFYLIFRVLINVINDNNR